MSDAYAAFEKRSAATLMRLEIGAKASLASFMPTSAFFEVRATSMSKLRRAIITEDAKGIYRVYTHYWDTSDWAAGYGAFWTGLNSIGTLTDRLEVAREFARLEVG